MGLKGAKNWLALAWLYYLVLLRRIIHRLIVPATKSPAQPPLTNGVPHKDKNHSKDLWFSRPFPCLVCSDDETLSLILLIPSSDADCLFFFWTKHHLLKTKQSFEKGSFLSTIMKPFPRKWTSTATRLRLHWKLKIRPPFYYYYRVLVYFQNALRNCTTTHMEIIGSASAENSWHWKLQFFTRRAVFCIYLGVMNNARSRKKRKTRIHISIL